MMYQLDGLTRRTALLSLLSSFPFITGGAAFAQSESEVNGIIKGLAPISRQTISGGYKPSRRESVKIDQRVIFVDLDRHVDIEVYFDYNSSLITSRARRQLRGLGEALGSSDLSGFRFLIAGHTDAVGLDGYNIDLSKRRAASVRDYLLETFPIHEDRLYVVGFGARKLKSPQAPRAAINRRVEILLIID